MIFTAWLYWNPPKDLFTVPLIDRPIAWYGFFFVLGIILSYVIVIAIFRTLLKEHQHMTDEKEIRSLALSLTDRLTWYVVLGIIVGARLAHVFFYDWPYFKERPVEILYVSQGGLASHGGVIGILLAIALYRKSIAAKFPKFTFWTLVDCVAVPAALAGACIRIGNFFNQEILGTPSTLPWAIIFGHPADQSAPTPRHPVQLYEALAYLIIFIFTFSLWKWTQVRWKPGFITGIFLILLFTVRFILEFFKTSQSLLIDETHIQMGQYLSLPFIFVGCLLLWSSRRSTSNEIS